MSAESNQAITKVLVLVLLRFENWLSSLIGEQLVLVLVLRHSIENRSNKLYQSLYHNAYLTFVSLFCFVVIARKRDSRSGLVKGFRFLKR